MVWVLSLCVIILGFVHVVCISADDDGEEEEEEEEEDLPERRPPHGAAMVCLAPNHWGHLDCFQFGHRKESWTHVTTHLSKSTGWTPPGVTPM